MTTPTTSPAQVVIAACADTIANVGILSEHLRQMVTQLENDPESAALHKRAAVQHAKAARSLMASGLSQLNAFIDQGEDKPRIQRV